MSANLSKRKLIAAMSAAAAVAVFGACTSMGQMAGSNTQTLTLSGANEVPPVVGSPMSGTATVTINPDRTVSVKVAVTGMTATASHIHEGAPGTNGPVIVPFTKTADNTFASPDGAKLTESQYASYKAGNLYVNVHSAAHPIGEIRAPIKGN
jgi:ABC-type Fe3+-hydroxamate transport system substrate-binding protein